MSGFSTTNGSIMKVSINNSLKSTYIGAFNAPSNTHFVPPTLPTLSVAPNREQCKNICAGMLKDSNVYMQCGETSILRSALAEEHGMVHCIGDMRQQAYDCSKTCDKLPQGRVMSGMEFMQKK